ncbi:MAG: RluA family pseudouridine synthase [Bacteroidales bacterium]|nr:RluA family pseudouridine synthase [Bacteroidales bacterium]MBR4138284.1 RluA family pseudouridine synthase [Bacteroidales bacterium]
MQNKKNDKIKDLIFKVLESDTLMPFVMKKMNGISRNKAKNILSSGSVSVDGKKVSQHDFELKPGMEVKIGRNQTGEQLNSHWVKIVYEDQYLFVVDKRSGILCNSPHPDEETVQCILNQYLERNHQRCHAHTIHRLDRDTSGLMLFAKDKKVALKFEENWKATVYDRRYVALVHGEMHKEEGTISSWLKDNAQFVTFSSKSDNGGKFATTHYKLIKVSNGYSLVELKLDTGRKNQIRVHLKDIGFPVVGDPKYGDGDDKIGRLGLHAFKLCFIHPVTGEDLKFETPFPKSFDI